MTHTAVTVKRAKAERVQGVRAVKKRDPKKSLGSPHTLWRIPRIRHTPVQPKCLSSSVPTPTPPPLSQRFLFPIRINHPVRCLLCKPPPSPGHTVPSTGAAAFPARLGASARKEWMEEGSPFYLRPGLPPPPPHTHIQQLGSQGTGAPTAAALDDLTLLPTWIPLGLERALALRQLVLGMLAPQLPRLELRFPTFQSSEAEDNGECGTL